MFDVGQDSVLESFRTDVRPTRVCRRMHTMKQSAMSRPPSVTGDWSYSLRDRARPFPLDDSRLRPYSGSLSNVDRRTRR